MVKIFIIILNWNGYPDTSECLKSLEKTKKDNFDLKVVIVDNASNPLDLQLLKVYIKGKDEYVLIENSENQGFVEGNNIGIKVALESGAEYIVLLNNDTIVDPSFLLNLYKTFEKDEKIGAVSPKIYFAKGYEFHKERYSSDDLGKIIWYGGGKIDWENVYASNQDVDEVDDGKHNQDIDTDFVTGACCMFSSKALKHVGLLDEKFFMYFEDTDISVRLRKKKWRVVYSPKSFIWHKVARSSSIGGGLNDYYTTRNRLIFGMRYANLRSKAALMRESIKMLYSGREWQKKGVIDFYLRKFCKGSFNPSKI